MLLKTSKETFLKVNLISQPFIYEYKVFYNRVYKWIRRLQDTHTSSSRRKFSIDIHTLIRKALTVQVM
jgi:hypothetical protein